MKLNAEKCARVMAEKCVDISILADRTGLTFKTVSQTVRGITEPRAKNLAKICAALECEPKELLED